MKSPCCRCISDDKSVQNDIKKQKTGASTSCNRILRVPTARAAVALDWGWGRWALVPGVGRLARLCWGWVGTLALGTVP